MDAVHAIAFLPRRAGYFKRYALRRLLIDLWGFRESLGKPDHMVGRRMEFLRKRLARDRLRNANACWRKWRIMRRDYLGMMTFC